jgi:hypothetical protein
MCDRRQRAIMREAVHLCRLPAVSALNYSVVSNDAIASEADTDDAGKVD